MSTSDRSFIFLERISQRQQKFLDDITPYTFARWLCAAFFILTFLIRVFVSQGWYIVTYALGIYHLNLLIGFLSPKIDPAFSEDFEEDQMPGLPTRQDEEFRPFIRRVPEFKCWWAVMRSTAFATFLTWFEVFDIPVFWPILLLYFIVLFCLTMKRQIKHMIKYRYIPFTWGKPKYQSADLSADTNTVKR
ncbi:protein RER1 [Planococcus citri]|uniref:protein RER1 n=1 Tax=Planococcus citri TaxID=170843 RepID=UPI0031F89FC5